MKQWLDVASQDSALMHQFLTVCSFGGRRSGSGQDEQALQWVSEQMQNAGYMMQTVSVPYEGWHCSQARLQLKSNGQALALHPLLRSASTPEQGVELSCVDLGAGRVADFERLGAEIEGKAVLVEHEYPFSATHLHRRRKYEMAVKYGAAAFLIASPWAGHGLLSGSSGRPRHGAGIPSAYIDFESAQLLRAKPHQRIILTIQGHEQENSMAPIGVFDVQGGLPGTIVLSAHMDGHELGESALDNASGVAVALATFRALAPLVGATTPSLRLCLFCAEEWALSGSAYYLDHMVKADREDIRLNINLDTVAGDMRLTALLSDFPELKSYVLEAAEQAELALDTWLPLMPNSDHANFARHGIAAFRLVAGFEQPDSKVNRILSAGDTRGVVLEEELRQALRLSCALGHLALTMPQSRLTQLSLR